MTSPSAPLELIVFAGLQAAGKSTYYRTHFAATHVHVSKDLMKNARNREARQQRLVEEALAAGRSVVVDNTNATAAARAPLVETGRRYCARVVAYHFESTVNDALARNRMREGLARVPDVAIFTTAKKFEAPSFSEGFDEVRVIAPIPAPTI